MSLGTFQRLFPNKQFTGLHYCSKTIEMYQCLSLGSSQHSSDGKERCSIRNLMSQMLILHLIYFSDMLVSEWKYYRLVLELQEKKYIFHSKKQSSIKLYQFPRWKKCLIPQNHTGKGRYLCIPLIQKVWGSYHLLNKEYWMSMLMCLKDSELFKENPTSSK